MGKSGSLYEFIDNPYALIGLIVCAGLALLSRSQVIKDPTTKRWLLGLAFAGVLAAVLIPAHRSGQVITAESITTHGAQAPVNIGNSGPINIGTSGEINLSPTAAGVAASTPTPTPKKAERQ